VDQRKNCQSVPHRLDPSTHNSSRVLRGVDLTVLPYSIRSTICGRRDRFNSAASRESIEEVGAPILNVGSREGDERGSIARLGIPPFRCSTIVANRPRGGLNGGRPECGRQEYVESEQRTGGHKS